MKATGIRKGDKFRCTWTGLIYTITDGFAGVYDLTLDGDSGVVLTKQFCDLSDTTRWEKLS